MKKKIVLMTSALMAISLLSGCNKHAHEWGEVVYTWSQDNKTCTAERVCKGDESHKETETVNTTYEVVDPAKCEKDGKGRYTADFTNEAFVDQTKDITLKAFGHEWGEVTYTWTDDNLSCTAKRVCTHDSSHIEEETVNSVVAALKEVTCTEDGFYNYTATFTNEAFQVQTKENVVVKALEHDYQFAEFVWGDDYSAQAKYVCSHDASHVQLHDATVNNEVTTQPGCETKGVRTYTATYDGHTDTKTDEVAATGHSLVAHAAKAATCTEGGNSAYWSCEDCDKFFSDENGEHEIAADSWIIAAKGHQMTHHDAVSSDICTSIGNIEYWSCSKCDKYFSDENGNTEIEKDSIKVQAAHVWNDPTYVWNEDHTKCTAKHVCQNDESHVEIEEVEATEGELESTGCWLYGLVAKFTKAGFESQIYDYYRFTLNEDKASYTVFPGNHLPSNVVIPGEVNKLPVTKIGKDAFYDKDTITSIFIPKTVVVIDGWAISYNDGITSIVFEEGSALERIESTGIAANYDLTTLTLPASLKYIGGIDGNVDLINIYFLGTMEQWRAIEKGYDWNWYTPGCGAIHCIDGDVDDHYVDDDPDDWDDDDEEDDW